MPSTAFPIESSALVVRAGRRIAVRGVDLRMDTGVHGLLGPNGAGKTTLIRALATIVRPESGQLAVLGADAAADELRAVRRSLGYLPQHFGFYPRYTVREFVEYLAWLKEMPAAAIGTAVERAIARVGLADRAGDRLGTLSGGMLRRAGLAQAIVNDPELLLLDEPTAGLDPEQRVAFRSLVREIGTDACVVVSTHLVEDVAAACSDVTILDEGEIAFTGDLEALLARAGGAEPGDVPLERAYTAVLRAHRADAELAGVGA